MKSKIEKMILDPAFDYLQPYFYNNPFALRCELGTGGEDEYMDNARRRAESIYRIMFPRGADAIIFSYWITDWSDTGDAGKKLYTDPDGLTDSYVREETRALRFLLDCLMKYRHVSVKNLKTYAEPGDPDFDERRRNRIVCYSDGVGFDDLGLIEKQIAGSSDSEVSLVSFDNECILSVYDDRGCDAVFADQEKMREFYPLLKPWFLPYDLLEMEKRFNAPPRFQ